MQGNILKDFMKTTKKKALKKEFTLREKVRIIFSGHYDNYRLKKV